MKPELLEHYPAWRDSGVEVVLVSLDESSEAFEQFTEEFSFIRTTDYQRWESQMVKDYHVHSIPSMILLSRDLEILIHPNSIGHIEAWVDWYLAQDNR